MIQLLHKHQLTKLCTVCSRILLNLKGREGIEDSFGWNISWTQFLAQNLTNFLRQVFGSICKTSCLSWCTHLQMFSFAVRNGRKKYYGFSRRLQGWTFVTNGSDRAWKKPRQNLQVILKMFSFVTALYFFLDHKQSRQVQICSWKFSRRYVPFNSVITFLLIWHFCSRDDIN